tara:strand:- start:54080 stop:54469 length:390 start_codon:yes stop_codon:yes gene_type:complete
MFALLVGDGSVDDLVHRFFDGQTFAVGQRDERVAASFDISNQFGVQDEGFAVESSELDHVWRTPRFQWTVRYGDCARRPKTVLTIEIGLLKGRSRLWAGCNDRLILEVFPQHAGETGTIDSTRPSQSCD